MEDESGADRIEYATTVLSGQGIAAAGGGDADEDAGAPPAGAADAAGDDLDRTDDPMTLYLHDVGGTALLTREGKAALAKRIEAGRRMMLDGLVVSLPAMAAVSAWGDAIHEGSLALRDAIDVGAAYGAGHRHGHCRAGADTTEDVHGDMDGTDGDRPPPSAMEAAMLPGAMEHRAERAVHRADRVRETSRSRSDDATCPMWSPTLRALSRVAFGSVSTIEPIGIALDAMGAGLLVALNCATGGYGGRESDDDDRRGYGPAWRARLDYPLLRKNGPGGSPASRLQPPAVP